MTGGSGLPSPDSCVRGMSNPITPYHKNCSSN
jgi:hypothetical protein